MQPKKPAKNRLMAQIHIAKKQLGLTDETYRAALKQVVGKDSCSKMSITELHQVISHFEQRGFKSSSRKPRAQVSANDRRGAYSPQSSGQQIDKLRAIWIEMHRAKHIKDGSERALLTWVKNQTAKMNGGVGVDSLEWLQQDRQMATRVLESLKLWQTRVTYNVPSKQPGTTRAGC